VEILCHLSITLASSEHFQHRMTACCTLWPTEPPLSPSPFLSYFLYQNPQCGVERGAHSHLYINYFAPAHACAPSFAKSFPLHSMLPDTHYTNPAPGNTVIRQTVGPDALHILATAHGVARSEKCGRRQAPRCYSRNGKTRSAQGCILEWDTV
jgi:hypothetical protein